MMSAFLKNVSRCAQTPSSVLKNPSRLAELRPRRPFSSDSDSDDCAAAQSPPQTYSAPSSKETASADVKDVSNEDLKQRIEKFMMTGDTEAIPSIFEAILQRKLSGKHKDREDEQLLKEMNLPEVNEDEEDI